MAEDNKINQMIAEAILTKAGFEIDIAEDGQIAVQKLSDAPAGTYDVILILSERSSDTAILSERWKIYEETAYCTILIDGFINGSIRTCRLFRKEQR